MKRTLALLALLISAGALAHGADISKLITETQRMSQGAKNLTLVWWIPTEFWDASLAQNPAVTEEQRKEFTAVLDRYVVIAVASVDIGAFGGMTPKSRDAVLENTELKIGGSVRAVLDDSEVSPDASNFVRMMKPMMANMLGQFGQGIEFMLYSNVGDDGERLIRATAQGRMNCTAFGNAFEWTLPLGSLLPPKLDPKTGQEFPGDFMFNPYTGTKLVTK